MPDAVNLKGAATGSTSPALAIAEVAYVAKRLGPSLLGIRIRSEPNFYRERTKPFAHNWSLPNFIALWQQYRNAILAVTLAVPCRIAKRRSYCDGADKQSATPTPLPTLSMPPRESSPSYS